MTATSEGYEAYLLGVAQSLNPYQKLSPLNLDWISGWDTAHADFERMRAAQIADAQDGVARAKAVAKQEGRSV